MINKLARKAQASEHVNLELFTAVKRVSYKIFERYGLPIEEYEAEAYLLITSLLKTWDRKRDFAVYLHSSSGYAVQKYRAYATVVRTPMKIEIQEYTTYNQSHDTGDGCFSVSNLDVSFKLDAIYTALGNREKLRVILDYLLEGYTQKDICKKMELSSSNVSLNVKELRIICKDLI